MGPLSSGPAQEALGRGKYSGLFEEGLQGADLLHREMYHEGWFCTPEVASKVVKKDATDWPNRGTRKAIPGTSRTPAAK